MASSGVYRYYRIDLVNVRVGIMLMAGFGWVCGTAGFWPFSGFDTYNCLGY